MKRVSFLVLLVLVASSLFAGAPPATVHGHDHQITAASHVHDAQPVDETVSYNTQTGKYHNSSCRYYNCGNCVKMSRSAAIAKGGVACKVCNG